VEGPDRVSGDRLVSDYLSRLHAAAWRLPADRRTALVDRVRHALLEAQEARGADGVRRATEALGDPAEVVRAELTAAPLAPPVPPVPRRDSAWGSREVAAVLLLSVGGVALPVVGPLVGLVIAWTSRRWTAAQKAVATGLAVLAPALLGLLAGGGSGGLWAVVLLVPLAGLVPAGYLAFVLRGAAADHDAGTDSPPRG
jgi:hypothetical protein